MASTLWSEAEVKLLQDNYAKVDSVSDMLPLLPGRTYWAIRSKAETMSLINKFLPTQDNTFFNEPNEINSAIAGFIAADGCVSDGGRLTINLGRKDRGHLETIIRLTKYEGNIYDYESKFSVAIVDGQPKRVAGQTFTSSVQIQAPIWVDNLKTHWNIVPRKTFLMVAPNISDNRLSLAYISGLIDGDGWVGVSTSYSYMIGVMGTHALMTWIKSVFDTIIPEGKPTNLKSVSEKDSYEYKVTGTKAYWLAKLLLSLDIPRLDRKWDKMREFIRFIETEPDRSTRRKSDLKKLKPSDNILHEFGLYESSTAFLAST